MTKEQLLKRFRQLVLGMSPLLVNQGCARSGVDYYTADGGIIVQQDGSVSFDAGMSDAGAPDAGKVDAGAFLPSLRCGFEPDAGIVSAFCVDVCAPVLTGINGLYKCEDEGNRVIGCYSSFCGVGRADPGSSSASAGIGLGKSFAAMAANEVEAVFAFEQLSRELAQHGLDDSFIEAALKSALQEREHAEVMSRATRATGGSFEVQRNEFESRTAFEIAKDNAVQGCVREHFGSLVGLFQSVNATSSLVRHSMAAVTKDEISHGAFSMELAQKLESLLTVSERRHVRELQRRALGELSSTLLNGHTESGRQELGLPNADQLNDLVGGWSRIVGLS
jgi:hypothetical protein